MEPLQILMAAALTAIAASIAILAVHSKGRLPTDADGPSIGHPMKRIKVADRNPANYPYSVRLSVADMTSAHGKRRVENALNAKGSLWAEADLKEGAVRVRMKDPLPDDTLRRIVSRAGCTVVGIEKQD